MLLPVLPRLEPHPRARFAAPDGIDDRTVLRAIPWLAFAAVLLWLVAGVGTSTSQWGDHFEQFAWSHGFELGYHKHPPLPTWLLAATIALFGPAVQWPYGLAVACVVGTGFFTHGVARELFGRPVAGLALLFWGLQQPFSARVHLFNHNTVLLLCTSATAWLLLRALDERRRSLYWLGAGITAGAALLSKYQALVPLAGFAVAAFLSGELASARCRRGFLVTALVALTILVPHACWVAEHGFTTLAYATQHGRSLPLPARAWNVVSFLAQQLRLVFPALLFGGLLLLLPKFECEPASCAVGQHAQRRRAWLFGLIGFPLVATVASCALLGIQLQNHWGNQMLQFAGLGLAWWVRPRTVSASRAWLALATFVHAGFVASAIAAAKPAPAGLGIRNDSLYPARALADAVRHDWQEHSRCPLAIVVGPTFEAGMISVYNGGTARVLEDGDFEKSPWLSRDDLLREGAAYVASDASRLPSLGVARVGWFDVGNLAPAASRRIYWAIVPPQGCVETTAAVALSPALRRR